MDLLRNRNPNAPLTFTDGLVGAVWNDNFITSPNTGYIPLPLTTSTLALRADYYYGVDDYLLWPQPFNNTYSHLSVIKCKPRRQDDEPNWIMWESFNKKFFNWPENDGCVGGFGRVKTDIVEQLSLCINDLIKKITDKEAHKRHNLPEVSLEYLNTTRLNLEFTFGRLKGMPITQDQGNRAWVEVQRAWQQLDALWDFLTVHRERITGRLPAATTAHDASTSRYIGAFTHDDRVAQWLFTAAIPVWLIRPMSLFTDQNILKIVDLRRPKLCTEFRPHQPILFQGHPGSAQKFKAIETASQLFSLNPDPFEIAERDRFVNTRPESSSPSSRIALRRSTHKSASSRTPYSKKKVQGGHISYLKPSRDKFAELDGPLAPPPIPAWAGANSRIDRSSSRTRISRVSSFDKGYFFPDPGLFFGVEKEWKPAAYFRQWIHLKDVWLLRAYTRSARPCTPQEWRDILSLGFLAPTIANSAVTRAVEHVKSLIGECLTAVGISINTLSRFLPQNELEALRIDPHEGRVLVWELCELNFRWELQALDHRLVKSRDLRRQKMFMRCFAGQSNCITSVDPSLACSGLAAKTFQERYPYLQAFWSLMNEWPSRKPSSWFECPLNPTESVAGDQWERDIVTFYAQSFYDHFGRPAILPRTLVDIPSI